MYQSGLVLLLCCAVTFSAWAQQDQNLQSELTPEKNERFCTGSCCCNGSQTPIGITTDHIHARGEWMVSYSYMDMTYRGNRTGTSRTSETSLYASGYMMAPATMEMHMHMAMLMYGVTDRFTLMAMGGYTTMSMAMNMPMMMMMPGMTEAGTSMNSASSGFADTRLSALYNFSKSEKMRVIGSLGINLPTGTIRATGTTMLGIGQRMPYDMQPGTGSFSVLPDVTWVRSAGKFALGADAGADVKLNTNSLGYRYGNVYHASAWVGYQLLSFMNISVRAEAINQDKISGADPKIAIAAYEEFDPTTSTSHYGGAWCSAYGGLNFFVNRPVLKNFQLSVEYGMPFYENLNGPQMSVHAAFQSGLQYRF